MSRKKTPPWYGLSLGPISVACQWKRSSPKPTFVQCCFGMGTNCVSQRYVPTGPAEQFAGGSLPRSASSLLILLTAMVYIGVYRKAVLSVSVRVRAWSTGCKN